MANIYLPVKNLIMLKVVRTQPKIKVNKKFIEHNRIAFKKTIEELGQAYQDVISDPNAFSQFPGQDIIDTGVLKRSQRMEAVRVDQYKISWDVSYANYVRSGYTLRNGDRQPGRDWVKEGNRRFDYVASYKKNIKGGR